LRCGGACRSGADQFDPAAFDPAEVNTALSGFAAVLIKN
jgi:hypothetical protein